MSSALARLRCEVRAALSPYLCHVERLPDAPSAIAVGAVDGALAIKRSLGADLVLAVAVGADGLSCSDGANLWAATPQAHWYALIPHLGAETPRVFAQGVMAALELELLALAHHEVVILDGSYVTPAIHLNGMLGLAELRLRRLAAEALSQHSTPRALQHVLGSQQIVALVKYDASRDIAQTWLAGYDLGYDDRTTFSVVLEAGEYTQPVPLGQTAEGRQNLRGLNVVQRDDFPGPPSLLRELDAALAPIRSFELYFLYYKPWPWSPAYRIELKRSAAEDPHQLALVLAAVRNEVVSPEVREPYPQYLADQLAKVVGLAVDGLSAAALAEAGRQDAEYLSLLAQSYRTEV